MKKNRKLLLVSFVALFLMGCGVRPEVVQVAQDNRMVVDTTLDSMIEEIALLPEEDQASAAFLLERLQYMKRAAAFLETSLVAGLSFEEYAELLRLKLEMEDGND